MLHLDPFTLGWSEAEALDSSHWGARSISASFAHAVRHDPPGAEDHVLFHTVGYAELLDLIDDLVRRPDRAGLPTTHILLRYDPWPMRQNAEVFRRRFRQVAASPILSGKVRFYSDTQPLAEAFSALSTVPFSLASIPFDQSLLMRKLRERQDDPGDIVTFAYLGDARLEKGYGLLPQAIREVQATADLRRRARFVLQSNFNVPGGEPGLSAAREELAAMSNVGLLDEALDEDAFYDVLVRSDVVILPYDRAAYGSRSSGLLVQARAAGKPIVTVARSWMASQLFPDHAVIYDDDRSLGSALVEACSRHASLARHARHRASAARQEASPERFIAGLLATAASEAPPVRDERVLVVMNGDAMVLRNGASRVAMAQFRYLQLARYRVGAVFIAYDPENVAGSLPEWKKRLFEQISRFDLEQVFVVAPSRLGLRDQPHAGGLQSIERDVETHRAIDLGADPLRFVRERRIDAILLKYVTTVPIVDVLGLAGTPIVCEMHDVQSLQKAIYGHRHVLHADIEHEMSLLDRCDHLVSLNPHEADFVRDHLPYRPVTTRGVFLPADEDFAARASATGSPPAPEGEPSPGRPGARTADGSIAAFDLLFVGSNHLPNMRGLRWFLDEVFLPALAPLGVTLVVAGSVADNGNWPSSPQISYLGRGDAVAPSYDAAKLAVLPVLEGAGGLIKTMEALRYGVPIVATTVAMRGIDRRMWGGATVADDAPGFRDAISALLASEASRSRHAEASRAAAATLCDADSYVRVMDDIFASVLGAGAATPRDTEPAPL